MKRTASFGARRGSPCNRSRKPPFSHGSPLETRNVHRTEVRPLSPLAGGAPARVVLHRAVVFGPVAATAYIALWVINTIDNWVKPWVPRSLSPDDYLPSMFPVSA